MTALSKPRLLELLKSENPLADDTINTSQQLQVNGFELTVNRIEEFTEAGAVDFDNTEREIAETRELSWEEDDWVTLSKGAYKIVFNEIVDIPPDVMALGLPRSSLLRNGATLETAVWDAGYRGRSECLLVVYNPHGFKVKKDARLLQLVFFQLDRGVREGYSGQYQEENL